MVLIRYYLLSNPLNHDYYLDKIYNYEILGNILQSNSEFIKNKCIYYVTYHLQNSKCMLYIYIYVCVNMCDASRWNEKGFNLCATHYITQEPDLVKILSTMSFALHTEL